MFGGVVCANAFHDSTWIRATEETSKRSRDVIANPTFARVYLHSGRSLSKHTLDTENDRPSVPRLLRHFRTVAGRAIECCRTRRCSHKVQASMEFICPHHPALSHPARPKGMVSELPILGSALTLPVRIRELFSMAREK